MRRWRMRSRRASGSNLRRSTGLSGSAILGQDPAGNGVVGAAGANGTTRFYRVAIAYVLMKNLRVTLAIRFVVAEDETVTIVRDRQKALKKLKIRVRRLFLDKGFAGIALMQELVRQGQPAEIACTIRGKAGGTRALCQGNKSYTHLTVVQVSDDLHLPRR